MVGRATPLTPLGAVARPTSAAYRADVGARPERTVEAADAWISVASLVEHAALVDDPERAGLLAHAANMARRSIGEAELARLAANEWGNAAGAASDPIALLTDAMQAADMLHLAGTTLDALLAADRSLSPVQQGRILAKRARVAWKLGQLDEAEARYRKVARLARREHSTELAARATIGFVAVAQLRGNYPELRRHAQRAVRLAERTGIRSLIRNAHSGMLIGAAVARSLDDALIHGWAVYRASAGDLVQEAEVLQNIGQALLDAAHTDAARAVFLTIVSRALPPRILLPALGSLALSSAEPEHGEAVVWAARQIRSFDERSVPRHALASALVECAIALARIGERRESELLRAHGLALAKAHGFHEIAYRAEDLEAGVDNERRAAPSLQTRAAADVVRELEWLKPDRLPEHITLAAGSTVD